MKHILAIDPATRLGFAHTSGRSGVVDLIGPNKENELFKWLKKQFAALSIDMIAIENASFGASGRKVGNQWKTIQFHNRLVGVIELVASRHGAKVIKLNITTIKKFATDKGNATKEEMMQACMKHLGINPRDDNEADALWILELAKRPDCWPVPKPKRKKRVVK